MSHRSGVLRLAPLLAVLLAGGLRGTVVVCCTANAAPTGVSVEASGCCPANVPAGCATCLRAPERVLPAGLPGAGPPSAAPSASLVAASPIPGLAVRAVPQLAGPTTHASLQPLHAQLLI